MTEVRSTSQYYYSLLPVHTFYCNHRFPCLYCVFKFSITFSTKACIPDVVNNLESVDLGEEAAIAYLQLLINLAVTSAWHNDIVRAAPRAVALLQCKYSNAELQVLIGHAKHGSLPVHPTPSPILLGESGTFSSQKYRVQHACADELSSFSVLWIIEWLRATLVTFKFSSMSESTLLR